ncbi:hypothetical protein AVEN_84233-1 [Araneus ventricosus]|uniref:Uncharacterized protein n=1 Tax=Araneus ventricosus TaxID=182803 RepID=A0A4Y2L465_ARAVE|nr:hypothetical protein AVEN_84233-1 [Araneus ventricosus]
MWPIVPPDGMLRHSIKVVAPGAPPSRASDLAKTKAKSNVSENDSENSESDEGKLSGDDRDREESGKSSVSQRIESKEESQARSGESTLSENLIEKISDLESEEMLDGLMQKALIAEREIQASLSLSKLSKEKQEEIRSSLQVLFKDCWEQQVRITHLMGTVSTVETKRDKPTYAQILEKPKDRDRSRSRTRK